MLIFRTDTLVKLLHVLAATVFVGNLIGTLIWKVAAEASGEELVIRHMLKTAILFDAVVTIPCSIAITLSGIWLGWNYWNQRAYPSWLSISIALWVVSAVLATAVLIPWLKRLSRLSVTHLGSQSHEYLTLSRWWNILAITLIVSPLLILSLMVLRP